MLSARQCVYQAELANLLAGIFPSPTSMHQCFFLHQASGIVALATAAVVVLLDCCCWTAEVGCHVRQGRSLSASSSRFINSKRTALTPRLYWHCADTRCRGAASRWPGP